MRSIKTTTALIIFYIFITTLAHAKIAEEHLNSGYDKVEQKDYEGAIQDFTKAIELDPDLDKTYHY